MKFKINKNMVEEEVDYSKLSTVAAEKAERA